MRIAFVTPGFSASDDDWCIPALQDLARTLNQRHDVRVFTTTYPHRRENYDVKGVPVSSFGNGRSGRVATSWRMYQTLTGIRKAHEAIPFDLLHGFWSDHGGVVARLAGRALAIPHVVTAMAGELTREPLTGYGKRRRPIAGRLALFGASRADALLVHSRFHADQLAKQQAALSPQVIPFGVDLGRFAPEGPVKDLQGKIPLLCAGSLVEVKGHTIVLEAFAKALALNMDMHLHVVGSGMAEAALHRQAAALGVSGQVSFHGHVEHDRLSAYYRGARFCVLGSYFESHAMVVVEAAACGRITIGSAVGSMSEFCPGECLSEPGDIEALANAIAHLANDESLSFSLGARAASIAVTRYELAKTVSDLERLYTTMLR